MSESTPTPESQNDTSLAADPQDHNRRGKRRVPLVIRYLLAIGLLLGAALAGYVLTLGDDPNEEQQEQVETASATDQAVRDLQASLQSLEGRMPSLEAQRSQLDQLEQRLQDAETATPAIDVTAVGERLDSLADTLDNARHRVDLQLTALAEGVEARISEAEATAASTSDTSSSSAAAPRRQPSTANARASSRATPPSPPRLPLKISGVEYRGGQPFLSIAEGSVNQLRDVRLLGERESVGDWQLLRITGDTAEFRYRDQTITIPLP
ncbi:hypothetical protein [Halomonas elongata]|uniref:Uncharacterized protein n=1 Tax=Halomonas elongata (strain ATCC 33173 / DSM 2581 / NBRC 15536 / NCIMB 2198 / 1H9) TaxID=768066 RepID=E1VA39_HALED|nr:hypothetical protein [Halomonas elongata]WBF17668.1 hypothetical protein LM502_16570 [Halomonas elongata]WPU46509.1 hypothetical protein SR933_14805 [Halomonas elongata DSM 2581]CBV43927.1 uncharacterized protein HELO_4043 [Halomonas elongata DSM 2581]